MRNDNSLQLGWPIPVKTALIQGRFHPCCKRPKEKVQWLSEYENYLHLSFQTPLMKFLDDVEFYLPADVPLIHMRSVSRLGYSDWVQIASA